MRYNLGDIVNSKEYDIENGTIIGVEMVDSNPHYNKHYWSVEDQIEDLDTYQYTVVYDFHGTVMVDTLYESLLDD